jgi:hypothetical protein
MFESGPSAYNRPSPGNTWTPWDTSLKGQWLHTSEWQKATKDEVKHSAQIWAESAADQIDRQAGRDAPFFIYVGFNSPHDPRQAPKEFVDLYPSGRIHIPPNYLSEHPFDQGDHRGRDEVLAPFPRTRKAVQVSGTRGLVCSPLPPAGSQCPRIGSAIWPGGAARLYRSQPARHRRYARLVVLAKSGSSHQRKGCSKDGRQRRKLTLGKVDLFSSAPWGRFPTVPDLPCLALTALWQVGNLPHGL